MTFVLLSLIVVVILAALGMTVAALVVAFIALCAIVVGAA